MAMGRYEYRYRVSVGDEEYKEKNGRNPPLPRSYKLEVRTNFILKRIDDSETVLDTEKFIDRLRVADDKKFLKMWGPESAFYASGKHKVDKSLRSRLSSYGMPDAQIRALVQTTFDLVRDPRHASLHTIHVVAAVDVCTVQSDGEPLAAAADRAVVPDVLTPLGLRLPNIATMLKPSKKIGLELRWYLKRLPVVRVREDEDIDDVASCPVCIEVMSSASEEGIIIDKYYVYHEKHSVGFKEGLRLMEECPICLRETIVGDKIASLPCKHAFHDHCIFRWLLKCQSCPVCLVDIKPDRKKLRKKFLDSLVH